MLKPAAHPLDHLLPVIDLKRGQVVHAVAGQRDQYQPLKSQLVDSFHPGRVAKALLDYVPMGEVYVADLDAIAGDEPDWNSFASIENAGAKLWLDAGAADTKKIRRITFRVPNVHRVIVALESLKKLRDLESLRLVLPPERLVFSLDLRDGQPFARCSAAKRMSPESIAAYAADEGIRSLIVLDLAAVGSDNGGESTVDLCRNIRARHPDIEMTSGGGVRNHDDVARFIEAGCDRVLVSTALHRGDLR